MNRWFLIWFSGYSSRGVIVELSARNGRGAMETAEKHKGEIDVLVSDVTMPELGGQELAEKLTAGRSLRFVQSSLFV